MVLHVQGYQLPDIAQLEDGLLSEGVVAVLAECLCRHLQHAGLRVGQKPNHLDEAIQRPDLHKDLYSLSVLPGREVHLAGGAEVAVLLGTGGLLEDEALRQGLLLRWRRWRRRCWHVAHAREGICLADGVRWRLLQGRTAHVRQRRLRWPSLLTLQRPVLGLLPLPQLRVHLHGGMEGAGAAVVLSRLPILALEGQHLCGDQHLLVMGKAGLVPVLLSDAIQQVDVPHVANADEGLPRDVEAKVLQGIQRQEPPIRLGDPKAAHSVGRLEVLLLHISVQRCALWHIDGLHGNVMQAEDLRALEAHHEALQLLHVRREVPRLDAQHVAAAVGQHVLHLRIPSHAVGIWLLIEELLGIQVVHEQVGGLINHR
mmetsp:Transcript_135567/g.321262  ORF Transcript_135567/g.321262 Transcript_135567/m.321262 type:complete len:370 (+) Transcript_135567:1458-2567(+)